MKRLIFLIYVLIGIFNLNLEINAQPTTWQRIFGLDSNVYGTKGIQTSDGGYLILSKWGAESVYPNRTQVIKLDEFGNLTWSRKYGVKTYDSVIEDGDSNYLLVGLGGAGAGAALLKINSNGDSLIYKLYGGPSISRFSFIKLYYDGGFIMCGNGSNGINIYVYIVRVDNNLNVIWAKTYNDTNYYDLLAGEFVFDPNNNIAITLAGYYDQLGFRDGGLLKLTPDGNTYIKQFYVTPSILDGFGNILLTNDNKYSISGAADKHLVDSLTTVYCSLDTNGNLITTKYYYDYPSSYHFLTKSTGNNLALGGSFRPTIFDVKMAVRKIDYSGNIIWTRVISSALTFSDPLSILSTMDGGYLLTGGYHNLQADRLSIYIIKTDSNAYAEPLAVSNLIIQVPDRFILNPAYPNPFNTSTKIKFEIKQSGNYKMEILDIQGKLISLVFNERLNTGFYEKGLSGHFHQLPSSIYFIRLSDFAQFKTQKILLIK